MRGAQISSRVTVTDSAIVNAVVARAPSSVLDLDYATNCLVLALTDLGLSTVGLDLIANASARHEKFKMLSCQQFAAGKWSPKVDCVVCNFCLLGKKLVEDVL